MLLCVSSPALRRRPLRPTLAARLVQTSIVRIAEQVVSCDDESVALQPHCLGKVLDSGICARHVWVVHLDKPVEALFGVCGTGLDAQDLVRCWGGT
jgi:hypothetical protein